MKVSICCITYNHAKFIEQALESFIFQKTDFDFEIIVSDDCSPDGTFSVIQSYQKKYPEKFKVIVNKTNVGMLPNFIQTLKLCTGEYIALCEGDDFWTDNLKLQSQVDFLDANSQFIGCFHNSEERYEESEVASFLYCNYSAAQKITFNDLAKANLMPTCSVVFRNNLFEDFPEWYYRLNMGDWTLHLLNARFGDFWYIPKVMGVHRLHTTSTWMLQSSLINNQHVINAYDALIKAFENDKQLVGYIKEGRALFVQRMTSKKSNETQAISINAIIKKKIKKIIRLKS